MSEEERGDSVDYLAISSIFFVYQFCKYSYTYALKMKNIVTMFDKIARILNVDER